MARWLFFDVGNVLLIDEQYGLALCSAVFEAARARGLNLDTRELMQERERIVTEEADSAPLDTLGVQLLGADEWGRAKGQVTEHFARSWMDFNVPVAGCDETLSLLGRHFRMGLAANQPRESRPYLEALGILEHFEVLGISGERGASKPEERFFMELLAEAESRPEDAVMIGDRLDNDVAPAQRLGFETVLVQYAPEEWWFPVPSPLATAYLESLRRAPARGCGPTNTEVTPDHVVGSMDQLVQVLLPRPDCR